MYIILFSHNTSHSVSGVGQILYKIFFSLHRFLYSFSCYNCTKAEFHFHCPYPLFMSNRTRNEDNHTKDDYDTTDENNNSNNNKST